MLSGTQACADQAEDEHDGGQQKQAAKLAAALVLPGFVTPSLLLPGLL